MKKRFVQNLFLLLFLNLLIKPVWILGIDRQVQNILGEEAYGLYFSLFSLGLLVQVLQDLGINNFNNRHMAQNEQLFHYYFPKIFTLKITLNVLAFAVLMLVGLALGYGANSLKLLAIILVNQSLLSLVLFIRSNLGGLHLFKKDRIISVLDRLIAIITVGALLVVPALTDLLSIKMFVLSQTVAYFITLLVGVQFLFGTKIKLKFRFSMPFAVSIIKQSLPYALLILMMFVYTRTDAVMIERIHPNGQYETGVYAKGFRILDALNMISYLFAVLLLPMFSRMIKNNEDLSPLANTAIRLLLFPMVSAVAIGVIFKEYWMVLLYWNTDQYQTFIFALTLLNAIPMAMVYIFGTLLTAGGKLKWLNIVAVLGVLLNISLNLYLIPTHGALGATYATILTQFVTAAVQVIIAIVIFKVKIPSTLQFQSAVFFGLLLFGIIIHYYLKLSDFMGITFLSLWSIALFFLSGIFKISEVRNILESRR